MKKIMVITALLLSVSTMSFAATSISIDLSGGKSTTGKTVYGAVTGSTADASSPIIGKTSTGVGVGMLTGATGYALVTQHMSGTKEFGSSYDSTSLFAKDTAVGTVPKVVPGASDTSDFSGWTKL